VFVVDVERCIKRLDQFEQVLVQRIALEAYTIEETQALTRCAFMSVVRRYDEALDKLSAMFLGNGMLKAKN
jgi:DNA-directed RNA polymerase specialized sigma24 family protein